MRTLARSPSSAQRRRMLELVTRTSSEDAYRTCPECGAHVPDVVVRKVRERHTVDALTITMLVLCTVILSMLLWLAAAAILFGSFFAGGGGVD